MRFVCSDMWKPYLRVITEMAPAAVNVLDLFHVMSHMSKAIDEVRAKEAGELKAKGKEPPVSKSSSAAGKIPTTHTACLSHPT